jgi:[protein-PII] uridylyltransferase
MTTPTASIHAAASQGLRRRIAELTARFLRGRQPDFLRQHARALDDYFQQAFEASMIGPRLEINKNPYAIVALGGYGREEQCVHSDVDLLFLFGKRIPPEAESLIREMIYPLWDIGMDVGYATRTVKESLALAAKDLSVLTPLLDARFLCGMSMLFTELMGQLREKVIRRRTAAVLAELVATAKSRHAQHGDSAYLLEPNLKEGQGGLRDYHTMLWAARVAHDLRQPRDLEYLGLLSHAEFQALREALGFVWLVRNHLHHLSGRKNDRLNFESQVALAETLRFKGDAAQQPVERFLGELHGRMETIKQHHRVLLRELGLEEKRRGKRPAPPRPVEGIEPTASGQLGFTGPEAILKRPELLIRLFEESAALKLPVSAEAKRLVREFRHLVDAGFRRSPEIVRAFERILLAPPSAVDVLDDMLGTGFLAAFLPPFAAIENRIQYDEYHVYPVDKHLLRTVQTIQELGAAERPAEPLAARLFRELKSKATLLWAALLHDVGKGGAGEDHALCGAALARRLLADKGLTAAEVETVAFLVREHLFLIKTATRRDIHDEETAIACARRIREAERLKMLYILTVADCIATGPAAWNDWTAHLLREFFFKVFNTIERGELATEAAVAAVEDKRRAVLAAAAAPAERAEFERLFAALSPRYLLSVPPAAIVEHLRLFRRLGGEAFVWEVRPAAEGATRTVTVCAQDRPGLMASIAGVFTLNRINILGVQVFTWKNRTALDVFEVSPPPDALFEEEKWARAAHQLGEVLAGRLDLAAALAPRLAEKAAPKPRAAARPHRVRVDNAASSFFTIVEVFTYDFPGLLFRVTDALFRCGLDIWVARIATKVDQVVDVFYVRDLNGQKVDAPERVAEIERAVLDRLPPPAAGAPAPGRRTPATASKSNEAR